MKESSLMSRDRRNLISYMVVCANDYANGHGCLPVDFFDYLCKKKGG